MKRFIPLVFVILALSFDGSPATNLGANAGRAHEVHAAIKVGTTRATVTAYDTDFVAAFAPSGAPTRITQSFGCASITSGTRRDFGCGLLTVVVDPTLATATVKGKFNAVSGWFSVNITMTGTGTHSVEPISEPCTGFVCERSGLAVKRPATPKGSIGSTRVGTITASTGAGELVSVATATAYGNL